MHLCLLIRFHLAALLIFNVLHLGTAVTFGGQISDEVHISIWE